MLIFEVSLRARCGGDHKEFQCQEGRGTMGQQSLSSRGTAVVNAITRLIRFTFSFFHSASTSGVLTCVSHSRGLWFLVGLHLLSSSRSAVYWYSPDPVRAIRDITPTHHIHIITSVSAALPSATTNSFGVLPKPHSHGSTGSLTPK